MNITKSAPLPERPCEQLTYCAKNESVQWDYINRVAKRHNCRITGKTKATCYGGHSTQATRYPQRMSIANNATFAAGGQCDQCAGLLVGYSCSLTSSCRDVFQVCDPIFVRLYSFKNFSRANAHGANLSCSCSLTAFLRCFFLDEDNFFNDLSVIVDTCNPVRHSSPHHSTGDGYSCSLALRRWRRLISPSNAAVTNCPVLSPSSLTLSIASTIWSGTRASILFDFAFTDFVAISDFRLVWCPTMIAIKKVNAMLDVSHTIKITCVRHLIFISNETTKPRTVGAVTGLLTKPLTGVTIMAVRQHTPRLAHTQTAFVWRFLALSAGESQIIHVTAWTEREARNHCPSGCVAVFAARIRQEVRHVQ